MSLLNGTGGDWKPADSVAGSEEENSNEETKLEGMALIGQNERSHKKTLEDVNPAALLPKGTTVQQFFVILREKIQSTSKYVGIHPMLKHFKLRCGIGGNKQQVRALHLWKCVYVFVLFSCFVCLHLFYFL